MNIAEILKDCPKGTKLYSPLFGEVEFIKIDKNSPFPITVSVLSSSHTAEGLKYFSEQGLYLQGYKDAECILFPSKENRDWSTFKVPKQEFKKGDFVYLEEEDGTPSIMLYKTTVGNKIYDFATLFLDTNELYYYDDECWGVLATIKTQRLATEAEKQELLKALGERGYVWDAEKLELRKKEHEFKPFEKVLVKSHNYNSGWMCDLFSHYDKENEKYVCVGGSWRECIPYEGNQELLGTINNPELLKGGEQ